MRNDNWTSSSPTDERVRHYPLVVPAVLLAAGIAASERTADLLPCDARTTVCLFATLTIVAATVAYLLKGSVWRQRVFLWTASLTTGVTLATTAWMQADRAWPQQPLTFDAVVTSEPMVGERMVRADVTTADNGSRLRLHIECDSSTAIAVGTALRVTARVKSVSSISEGPFNYKHYLAARGISGTAYVTAANWRQAAVTLHRLSALTRMRLRLLMVRSQLLEHMSRWGVGNDAEGVLRAMTLGDKSRIDASQRDLYTIAGVSHILALSGMHLTVIFIIISLCVGNRKRRILSQAAIIAAIWLFALLTGLAASITRAAAVLTVYTLLDAGNRRRRPLNILAFVALVMLAVSPLVLWDVGFQLSFTAIAGILLLHPVLRSLLSERWLLRHSITGKLWDALTVSTAAQVATAPLVVLYFNRLSVWFLVGNLLAVPVLWAVLLLTAVTMCVFWWPALQSASAALLGAVISMFNGALLFISSLPIADIGNVSISTGQAALLYIIIMCSFLLLRMAENKPAA